MAIVKTATRCGRNETTECYLPLPVKIIQSVQLRGVELRRIQYFDIEVNSTQMR
jgi:hypothetical protein